MTKHLRSIVEKTSLEGVKSSKIRKPDLSDLNASPGNVKFAASHETEDHEDRVGNGDDVYKGKTKQAPEERHGNTTKGKSEKSYEKMNEETDYEGEMAKSQLMVLAKRAEKLANMLQDNTQLEAWVQSKITKAEDYVTTVYDYMKTTGKKMNEDSKCNMSEQGSMCEVHGDDKCPGYKKGKKLLIDKKTAKEDGSALKPGGVEERVLTSAEKRKKEKYVKSMKGADWEERYPGSGKEVMYATATKMAKKHKKKD
jgi:hypothetical protein